MAKLYVYQTPNRLVPAFRVPNDWLKGWPEHGFDNVFRLLVPQKASAFKPEPHDVLAVVPHATVEIVKAWHVKAYREIPVSHVVLLGGGRWLVGHPEVEELEYAAIAPV